MNSYDLLYVLEKVKAACPDKYGVFHTTSGTPDYEACRQLERDGLIRKINNDLEEQECDHYMWVLR